MSLTKPALAVRLQRQRARLEAEKRLLKTRPFALDHAPGKPRREHPFGHFGENPVVAEPGEHLWVGLGRQQLRKRLGTALALLGPGANGLERDHGGRPLERRQMWKTGAKRLQTAV
jgi:hypothetical protein